MNRFMLALLNGGEYNGVQILNPSTVEMMFTQQFTIHENWVASPMGFSNTWRTATSFSCATEMAWALPAAWYCSLIRIWAFSSATIPAQERCAWIS
jgi:hypothetical protein